MNIRKLEDLSKDELIDLIKQERELDHVPAVGHMNGLNWIVYDKTDLSIFSICEDRIKAAAIRKELCKILPDCKGHILYDPVIVYDLKIRKHELKAQIAATIYAGVIATNEDTDLSMDWAIGRAETLLEEIR